MTFDEIVADVMAPLNLTSTEATARVGRMVNRYYKRVTTEIGIAPVARRVFAVEALTTIASEEVIFEMMENITRVYYIVDGVKQFLDEVTIDELRDADPPSGDTPARWAKVALGANSDTIHLDQLAETEYTLYADGYAMTDTLADDDEPAFPESFHDVLILGPLKDEYKKAKNLDLAKDTRGEYEERLSALKYWAARTAYLKIRQGERGRRSQHKRANSGTP